MRHFSTNIDGKSWLLQKEPLDRCPCRFLTYQIEKTLLIFKKSVARYRSVYQIDIETKTE
ncbi:MAG: hypothetical protein DWH80_04530 [Planctomycetota bacterium]|nr:MAG: hypothetical protein DWH80_04530 [Planctomycetota bacterium]